MGMLRDVVFFSIKNDKDLLIEFEDGSALLELNMPEEIDILERLLKDKNFWANFLSSLSAALTQHLGNKND